MIFDDSLQGALGVTKELNESKHRSSDAEKRFFIKSDEIIHLVDCDCVVCSQWGIFNINNFITRAIELGFKIDKI